MPFAAATRSAQNVTTKTSQVRQWRGFGKVLGEFAENRVAEVTGNAKIVAELATIYRSQFKPMFELAHDGWGSRYLAEWLSLCQGK